MARYQLQYLVRPGATEAVEADDVEGAEDLARLRLLFREPGFSIAILLDGQEIRRVTQHPRALPLRI